MNMKGLKTIQTRIISKLFPDFRMERPRKISRTTAPVGATDENRNECWSLSLQKWGGYTRRLQTYLVVTLRDYNPLLFFRRMGWDWVHLVRRPPFGLLYQGKITDEYGAVGEKRPGRGNWSTRIKPASVPLSAPQIPQDLIWDRTGAAAVGSRWLTAWAMTRLLMNHYRLFNVTKWRWYPYMLFLRKHKICEAHFYYLLLLWLLNSAELNFHFSFSFL
jgi:hypothetical protein